MPYGAGVQITGEFKPEYAQVLSYEALAFLADIHRRFNYTRKQVLDKRQQIQGSINTGKPIGYPEHNHEKDWKVAQVPHDLQMRHVEITGPTDRKMVINALNSGADMYMADFEDSLTPTWNNVIEGQINLLDANKKTISFVNKDGEIGLPSFEDLVWCGTAAAYINVNLFLYFWSSGSVRRLKDKTACLLVRVRGLHLDEKHILCDGVPMAGAFVDFGLYFFHNVHLRLANGTAPYFYIPKLETHFGTRLWNDVFKAAQDYMDVPQGL